LLEQLKGLEKNVSVVVRSLCQEQIIVIKKEQLERKIVKLFYHDEVNFGAIRKLCSS
jgi:hypothetical protein